jgi:hypothetical protein
MEAQSINQESLIKLLRAGQDISAYQIKLDDTKIEVLDAILLRKNGITVPDELVYYADDEIDFEDDPDINEEDFETGRLIRIISAEILVDKEISDWIRNDNINVNSLLRDLIESFYHNMKSLSRSNKTG